MRENRFVSKADVFSQRKRQLLEPKTEMVSDEAKKKRDIKICGKDHKKLNFC